MRRKSRQIIPFFPLGQWETKIKEYAVFLGVYRTLCSICAIISSNVFDQFTTRNFLLLLSSIFYYSASCLHTRGNILKYLYFNYYIFSIIEHSIKYITERVFGDFIFSSVDSLVEKFLSFSRMNLSVLNKPTWPDVYRWFHSRTKSSKNAFDNISGIHRFITKPRALIDRSLSWASDNFSSFRSTKLLTCTT